MLSDASAYNIQFLGTNPIFIDVLSFRPYREGEFWQGHKQFCEQLLNPLLLRALLGVPHNAWFRGTQEGISSEDLAHLLPWRRWLSRNLLTHVFLPVYFQKSAGNSGRNLDSKAIAKATFSKEALIRMLSRLRDWIGGLEPRDAGKTVWQGYAEATSYSSEETKAKEAFVTAFATKHRPGLIWDLGCNVGRYSDIALAAGARHVIGFLNLNIPLKDIQEVQIFKLYEITSHGLLVLNKSGHTNMFIMDNPNEIKKEILNCLSLH